MPAPNGAGWNNADVTVSFTANGDSGGSGVAYCTSDQHVTSETTGTLVSGSCTDVAGHTSPLTSVMVKLDKTAPQTTIAAGPPNPTGSTSATLAFGASEAASFECRLDEGAWMACTNPSVYNDLAKSSHQFEVRASDVAGNTDATPAQYAWTNGKTPKTTISGRPRSPTNSTHASFTFTSSDPGASYECSLDGGPFSTCISPTSYTGLGDGGHTFAVNATDAARRAARSPPPPSGRSTPPRRRRQSPATP